MNHTPNESEYQLQGFLENKKDTYTTLQLNPQGDATVIQKEPVNLCTVNVHGREYLFGGISEKFYDKMVSLFDWREDCVRKTKIINN